MTIHSQKCKDPEQKNEGRMGEEKKIFAAPLFSYNIDFLKKNSK